MTRPSNVLLILGALVFTACGKKEDAQSTPSTPSSEQASAVQSAPANKSATQPAPAPQPAAHVATQAAPNPAPAPVAEDATPTAGSQANPQSDQPSPIAYYTPQPAYPMEMIESATEGEVRVKFRVNTDGSVDNVEIVSATDPAFADALKTVLPEWRFYPARKDGVPVPRTVALTAPFRITSRTDRPDRDDYPMLTVIDRPPHPEGNESGRVVAQLNIDATARITNMKILKTEGQVGDTDKVLEALSHWVFLPMRSEDEYVSAEVKVEFLFTEGGNTLVQYPYPAPSPQGDRSAAASN